MLHIMAGVRPTKVAGAGASKNTPSVDGIGDQQDDVPLVSTPL